MSDLEKALALIEKEKLEKTGELYLGDCGLTELPEELRELVWLKKLSLRHFKIISNNYRIISHSDKSNKLEKLPNWLDELKDLEEFTCYNTKIDTLKPLSKLYKLKRLMISNTNIISLEPISDLLNLEELNCGATKIDTLKPLSNLHKLKKLYVSDTHIITLEPISSLLNLEELYCSGTKIDTLKPLSQLHHLKELYVINTNISTLESISSLSNLVFFEFSGTKINTLEPLKNLVKLAHINLSSTNVSSLEPIIRINSNQQPFAIDAYNCPLIIPPIEFVPHGYQAIKEYLSQIRENAKNLNEVKIIFLGEGASGKTSLIKRLRNEEFDPDESQTHGIRIRKTPFKVDQENLSAHLWDFGGQEVMHATHQFFLSQRCIYVIVLDTRVDDKAEYWLKYASSFGGKSPVLVVLNKIDENSSFEVNRKLLSEKYPNIHSYHRLSCKKKEGIEEFKQSLTKVINQSDTRRTPFPSTWLAVKDHFDNMQKDYIESAEYRQICIEKGVDKTVSQDVLLQFLHDLGVIINFRNLKNFDTQILNPLWLTNGVYRIINSKIVADKKGILHENEFDEVINDPRYIEGNTTEKNYDYPRNKLHYIVRVMQEFELCFQLYERQYIVPQLLPVQEPDFNFQGTKLHFEIHFPEFLPDSIFPRLMVKLHRFIKQELRWRSGMILEKLNVFNATARIRADKEDKKIRIDVYGEEPRRFLSFIRETVKEICEDFTNLNFEEMVPIPDSNEFLEYEALVEAEKAEEKEIFVWQVKKRISIAYLLDGIEDAAMRLEQKPVKVFISYSHKDIDHLKTLDAALSPLKRLKKLQLWYDRAIDAGSDWEKEIFQQLDEADIVLCLVSQDFINSDFCYLREFQAVLKQHHKGEKIVVPIQVRKCYWDNLDLAKIQGIPGKWITSQPNKDEAWTEVAKSLDPIIDKVKQKLRKSNKLEVGL
jgi:internalin A